MATKVILPKVDMDQEIGTFIEWLKKEGDSVDKGEPIFVIETDKVAIDIESPAAGILHGIQAKPGEIIPIGKVIAYILEPGEDLPENTTPQNFSTSPDLKETTPTIRSVDLNATPVARKIATTHDIDLREVLGTGPRGQITKRDVQSKLNTPPGIRSGEVKVYATPSARRVARQREIDLTGVMGSGPGTRIQVADVPTETTSLPEMVPSKNYNVIPLQGMRQTIAKRMTASYQTVPHISFTVRVDMGRFQELRTQLNIRAEKLNQPSISMTSLLVKAVVWALNLHPLLNSSLQDDEIHLFPDVNVGVAVALPDGLIVPVVHKANRKGLGEINNEVNDLVARSRQGQLNPADVSGGTFTISNLGPFGIDQFTAIINPPQAAILAIGAIRPELALDTSGQVKTQSIMRMTLSADHRVLDGAVVAYFLNDLRDVLESPELLIW
jgi:pyruvate dehydrogenase E2 component (dihydrolipoamide acetyltransferase)